MSDFASDVREGPPTPHPESKGDASAGESSIREAKQPVADSPTIITGRLPLAMPSLSESVSRLLEGRVMPGDRLGHFELVEYVGGGGMGRVFRAIDTQLGRTVALKVLAPEQASDADALQRFQNEAQSSARLDHDNIARTYYLGEDRGLHFIVFEFVEGVNLRVLVERKGPLSLAEAVSYTLQVAEALAHADARAVVHRDIKPSNVLITPDGRVKLIDLGLARLRESDPAVADLTASGVTLGTFDYISPEQARDPRNADIRSDIYSLGCTFFFLLAGQPPFPEGTVLQKLLQHQGDQPPDIRQFRPELPEEAGRVLRKMMAKEPGRRYASPGDLDADLLMLAEQMGLRPMSPTSRIWLAPNEPSVSFFRQHLPWIAPVAALVCIVLMLDKFWSWRDEQLPPPSAELAEHLLKHPRISEPKTPARGGDQASTSGKPAGKSAAAPPVTRTANATRRREAGTGPIAPRERRDPPDGEVADERSVTGVASSVVQSRSATAGESRPTTSADPASSPDGAAPKRAGLLVVTESPQGDAQYATLAAACAAAHNGDVIELQFDGPREDRPVKIPNLRLTIRAGEGRQPIVVFRPTDADPVRYPRSMFTLAGGQVTLTGVAAELQVPRGVPAENWSLLETWGGEMVRLEHCSLTVLNTSDQGATYHQDVAFFRARLAPDADPGVGGVTAATPLASIELTDCIARGEAEFLHVEDLQPVHLTWDNGLLLTTERLLGAGGGQTAPSLDEMLRIELHHVTVVTRAGLCRLTNSAANPYQLTVQFVASNSILIGASGVPLVEQEGTATLENFRQRFVWNGERNFYQGVDVFWTIRNLDAETPPNMMGFEAWQAYWGPSREDQPSTEHLVWKRPADADTPLHAHRADDYTLEDPMFGDAAAGAPGCRVDRLPTLLLEPSPHTPSRPGSAHSTSATRPTARR